jgi:hypothetical protein
MNKEKEFEKQQLNILIDSLKDKEKYTSFKKGAFIYDLGIYQGLLLTRYILELEKKLDAIKFYIEQSDIKNMLWGKEILEIIGDNNEKN